MTLDREACYQALFDMVTTDPAVQALFPTRSRFLRHHADVADSECPALFTFELPERRTYRGRGIPPIRTLGMAFIAYSAQTNGDGSIPATMVNVMADAIDNAITVPTNPDAVRTLGGQVEHVYIEPDIKPYEGLLQEKSVLVAVVSMLVP